MYSLCFELIFFFERVLINFLSLFVLLWMNIYQFLFQLERSIIPLVRIVTTPITHAALKRSFSVILINFHPSYLPVNRFSKYVAYAICAPFYKLRLELPSTIARFRAAVTIKTS